MKYMSYHQSWVYMLHVQVGLVVPHKNNLFERLVVKINLVYYQ